MIKESTYLYLEIFTEVAYCQNELTTN